ncbi:unnamed protein product [Effrenium voratum]|nr:unnamed protein product [Effrenium voratum]
MALPVPTGPEPAKPKNGASKPKSEREQLLGDIFQDLSDFCGTPGRATVKAPIWDSGTFGVACRQAMGWLCACSALGGLVLAAGDAVVTQRENEGLQDGRHDVFPCLTEPEVIPWKSAPVFKVNHEPYTNTKKVFVRKGQVPPLTQLSVADFAAAGYFEDHDHEDMFEIFYVLNGTGKFAITWRGQDQHWTRTELAAEPGMFLYMPPGVQHAGLTDSGLQFLMVGAATTDKACTKTAILGGDADACNATTAFKQLHTAKVAHRALREDSQVQSGQLLTAGELPMAGGLEHLTVPPGQSYTGHDQMHTSVFYVLSGWGGIRFSTKTGLLEANTAVVVPAQVEYSIMAAGPLELLRLALHPCPRAHDEL